MGGLFSFPIRAGIAILARGGFLCLESPELRRMRAAERNAPLEIHGGIRTAPTAGRCSGNVAIGVKSRRASPPGRSPSRRVERDGVDRSRGPAARIVREHRLAAVFHYRDGIDPREPSVMVVMDDGSIADDCLPTEWCASLHAPYWLLHHAAYCLECSAWRVTRGTRSGR